MCDQLELLDLGRKSEGRFPFTIVVDDIGCRLGRRPQQRLALLHPDASDD
ncbi:hypothetical protein [Caballeronia sordidicola]|jgi:hypothetical protein|nr:hypothetical protein [Caballeronia sordidicola]